MTSTFSSAEELTTVSSTLRENELSIAFLVTFEIVRVCESLLAIAGNGLTIACILRYKRLWLPTNYLVASLAFSDLLSGINHMVFMELAVTRDPIRWKFLCKANQTVAMLVTASNAIHIPIIAIDRYLAVTRPISYRQLITKQRVLLCIFIKWLLIIGVYIPLMLVCTHDMTGLEDICSYLTILPKYIFHAAGFPVALVASVVTVTSYALIYWRLRKHSRRMSHTQVGTTQRHLVSQDTHEQSVTGAMLIVVLIFTVSTLPPAIYTAFADYDSPSSHYIFRTMIALWYISSFINPFIYAWKNHRYRQSFKCMLRCKGQGDTGHGLRPVSMRA